MPSNPQPIPQSDLQSLSDFVTEQVCSLPNPKDVTWSEAEYPGDEDEPGFKFRYREFTGHDRLVVARWEHDRAVAYDTAAIDDQENEHLQLTIESAACAIRMETLDGEPYNEAALVALFGRSPTAWLWISQLLYAPVWQESKSGARRRKLDRRSQLLLLLQRLTLVVRRETAGTV